MIIINNPVKNSIKKSLSITNVPEPTPSTIKVRMTIVKRTKIQMVKFCDMIKSFRGFLNPFFPLPVYQPNTYRIGADL